MWNSERVEKLEKIIRGYEDQISKHEDKTSRLKENHKIELERLTTKLEDEKARIEANVDTKMIEATTAKDKEIAKLTIENEGSKQKVSMYEKAFENLGFDVKDMKDILNKLVDGLVSKNEIKVLSTSK